MKDIIDLSKMESYKTITSKNFIRLNRYWKNPSNLMWDNLWSNSNFNLTLNNGRKGHLDAFLENILYKHFLYKINNNNNKVRILEAGCGIGQIVVALNSRGYNCYGLDFARNTIRRLKNIFPNIPFDHGDIRYLPYKNSFFDIYISLGVIEHFQNGQDLILKEAARVLKKGGVAFVSVPFLNRFRRIKCNIGLYDTKPKLPFFESCFSLDELKELFNEAGFDLIDYKYQNPVMPFIQETFLRSLYFLIEDVRILRGPIDRLLNFILPKFFFGHMIMIIAKKK
jgi:ubiquinone/menaquinone biosynthesis C-methylase UbiE